MILDLIALFVSFLCLIVMLMILRSVRFNKKINIPFFIIILFVGMQRFQSSLTNLNLLDIKSPFESFPFYSLLFIPLFVFFFKESVEDKSTSFKDLTHLILPLIIIVFRRLGFLSDQIGRLVFFIFTLSYWILILLIIIRYYKKTLSKYSFSKINLRWLILVFSNVSLILFFLNYTVIYWKLNQSDISLDKFYRGSSILWAVALLYLVLNPVIIFGKDYLLNQLTLKSKLFSPWSYKTIKKTDAKDQILLNKLNKSIPELIYALKLLEQDFNFIIQKKINAKNLSKKLKIPNAHLRFVFKYHCKLSFHEYLNLLKIALAIELIGQGFLNDRTIDSLSNSCHFESRNTFYKNFKKFTGSSPSEFS